MAAEFARSRQGVEYSVQVAIVCETSSVTQALAAGGDVWMVPMSFRGRSCFRVFWGTYDSREAAERGMSTVPASLRDSRAAVVRPREILR